MFYSWNLLIKKSRVVGSLIFQEVGKFNFKKFRSLGSLCPLRANLPNRKKYSFKNFNEEKYISLIKIKYETHNHNSHIKYIFETYWKLIIGINIKDYYEGLIFKRLICLYMDQRQYTGPQKI